MHAERFLRPEVGQGGAGAERHSQVDAFGIAPVEKTVVLLVAGEAIRSVRPSAEAFKGSSLTIHLPASSAVVEMLKVLQSMLWR